MSIKGLAKTLTVAAGVTMVGGIGGIVINSGIAHKNAEATCAALAQGESPNTRAYSPYYGTPRPLVNDARFGLEVPGGPIFRNLHGNSFEPWSMAGMDDAHRIADYCNSEFQLVTEGNLTAEQVQIVLLNADPNYAETRLR